MNDKKNWPTFVKKTNELRGTKDSPEAIYAQVKKYRPDLLIGMKNIPYELNPQQFQLEYTIPKAAVDVGESLATTINPLSSAQDRSQSIGRMFKNLSQDAPDFLRKALTTAQIGGSIATPVPLSSAIVGGTELLKGALANETPLLKNLRNAGIMAGTDAALGYAGGWVGNKLKNKIAQMAQKKAKNTVGGRLVDKWMRMLQRGENPKYDPDIRYEEALQDEIKNQKFPLIKKGVGEKIGELSEELKDVGFNRKEATNILKELKKEGKLMAPRIAESPVNTPEYVPIQEEKFFGSLKRILSNIIKTDEAIEKGSIMAENKAGKRILITQKELMKQLGEHGEEFVNSLKELKLIKPDANEALTGVYGLNQLKRIAQEMKRHLGGYRKGYSGVRKKTPLLDKFEKKIMELIDTSLEGHAMKEPFKRANKTYSKIMELEGKMQSPQLGMLNRMTPKKLTEVYPVSRFAPNLIDEKELRFLDKIGGKPITDRIINQNIAKGVKELAETWGPSPSRQWWWQVYRTLQPLGSPKNLMEIALKKGSKTRAAGKYGSKAIKALIEQIITPNE